MPGKITFNQFNSGGLADSLYAGVPNSYYKMIGNNIHDIPGLLTINQKLISDANELIDSPVEAVVVCSDGNTYYFSKTNGKIWSRDSDGVWALEATVTSSAGVLNAIEYEGYILYFTAANVGRWQIGSAWSTRADTWAAFDNDDNTYHPAKIVNDTCYIGDGYLVAQVDPAFTFTSNALDLPKQYRISSLGQTNKTNLLIGTVIDNVDTCSIFMWNTWSSSWQDEDVVGEHGVWSIMDYDNITFVNAGYSGTIYIYVPGQLEPYLKIPGMYSDTAQVKIKPNAWAYRDQKLFFGVSQVQGNPLSNGYGIYSLGRYRKGYPIVMNMDYPISQRTEDAEDANYPYVLSDLSIESVQFINGLLNATWTDSNDTPAYGVDILDPSSKLELGIIETRVTSMPDEWLNTEFARHVVKYKLLPSNTDVSLKYKQNHAASFVDLGVVDNSILKIFESRLDVDANTLQYRLELSSNNNDSPEVEQFCGYTE